MQGSKTRHVVTVGVAAALITVGFGGCTVHNYPAPPPSPAEQQRQQQSRQLQQASAAPNNNPKPPAAPAPATRDAAAPAPASPPAQQQLQPQQQQQKPAVAPTAAAGRSYTVKPGDNLWNISKDVYGDGTKYQRILDANPGLNPDHMKPGAKIVIP